jgi:hypothetical protein
MANKLVILDQETGEIRGEYQPKRTRRTRTQYSMIFNGIIAEDKVNLTSLMISIIAYMDKHNVLRLDKRDYRQILKLNEISGIQVIHNTLRKMKEQGIIERITRGMYFVNPYYFAKTNQYQIDILRNEFDKIVRFNTEEQRKKTKLVLLKMSNESNETHLIIDDDEPL